MASSIWLQRMKDLGRGSARPHPPMFAPVIHGVSAQINALTPQDIVFDGTALRKHVLELSRALSLHSVFCIAPSGIEAEALGLEHDLSAWPPKPVQRGAERLPAEFDEESFLASPRLAASLDAARQLSSEAGDRVVAAALTGPARLVTELRGAGWPVDEEAAYEIVGRMSAVLVRNLAEAGVHAVVWVEASGPEEADHDHWKGALGTAGNMARFYKLPSLLAFGESAPATWPAQAIACPAAGQTPAPRGRPHGAAWRPDVATWPLAAAPDAEPRIIVTAGEVPCGTPVSDLMEAVERSSGIFE